MSHQPYSEKWYMAKIKAERWSKMNVKQLGHEYELIKEGKCNFIQLDLSLIYIKDYFKKYMKKRIILSIKYLLDSFNYYIQKKIVMDYLLKRKKWSLPFDKSKLREDMIYVDINQKPFIVFETRRYYISWTKK